MQSRATVGPLAPGLPRPCWRQLPPPGPSQLPRLSISNSARSLCPDSSRRGTGSFCQLQRRRAVLAALPHDHTASGSAGGSAGGAGTDAGPSSEGASSTTSRPRVALASVDEDAAVGIDMVGGIGGSSDAPASPLPQQVAAALALDRDDWKEESRRNFRTVFDFDRWAAHRSTRRYLRHVSGMPRSRIIRALSTPLLYMFGLTTALASYHTAAEAGLLPDASLSLPAEPFGLTSFALSLLLVFRTDASYSRWRDARKNWDLIAGRSRDLVRQGVTYIPTHQAPLVDLLCRWTVAFSRCLMCHLRADSDAEAELRRLLPPEEAASAMAAQHRPTYCLQVLSEVIKAAQLSPPQQAQQAASGASSHSSNGATAAAAQPPPSPEASAHTHTHTHTQHLHIQGDLPHRPQALAQAPLVVTSGAAYRMDENLTAFQDAMASCERIFRTPIPLSYTRHTSRFMMIWLTLLPFSLWESCRWASIPLCCIIAFLLLGIEEIGVAIEEPFSILPLEALCDMLERNIWELQAQHQAAAAAGAPGPEGSGGGRLSAAGIVAAAMQAPPQQER